jgi:hypothetical protein
MAFDLSDVGIERGTTKVLFNHPPIIEHRHAESGQDTIYEVAVPGNPVAVQYVPSQAKIFLRLRWEQVTPAQMATLETLRAGAGLITVKLTPGSATTLTCVFGPDSEQEITPYTGDYPESDKIGGALPDLMKTYRVRLTLIRMA